MKLLLLLALALSTFATGSTTLSGDAATQEADKETTREVTVDGDAAVHLPPVVVPFSRFTSPEAKAAFQRRQKNFDASMRQRFASMTTAERRGWIAGYFQSPLDRTKALYPTHSVVMRIAGVNTRVFSPAAGILRRNQYRVLINLHGGGFDDNAPIFGELESIPVASLLKVKVVMVDYRGGPEHRFPAASEDVAAVYAELLNTYPARNIGIYGCSDGGLLTAQAVAWIAKKGLARPGAIGILCASAAGWNEGDSAYLSDLLSGDAPSRTDGAAPPREAYLQDADLTDPLVEPVRSAAVLAQFPPTLIVTSTRDMALSPAVYTHTQLVKLGVEAQLHVWEGMLHAFFTVEPDLPETREALDVIVRFFDRHLGTSTKSPSPHNEAD